MYAEFMRNQILVLNILELRRSLAATISQYDFGEYYQGKKHVSFI